MRQWVRCTWNLIYILILGPRADFFLSILFNSTIPSWYIYCIVYTRFNYISYTNILMLAFCTTTLPWPYHHYHIQPSIYDYICSYIGILYCMDYAWYIYKFYRFNKNVFTYTTSIQCNALWDSHKNDAIKKKVFPRRQ